MSPRRSVVWTHFFKAPEKNVSVCKLCTKRVHSSGNTTNMFKHLETKHRATFIALRRQESSNSGRRFEEPEVEENGVAPDSVVLETDVFPIVGEKCIDGAEPVEIPIEELVSLQGMDHDNTERHERHIRPRKRRWNDAFLESQEKIVKSIDSVATELREVRSSLNNLNETLQTLVSCVTQLANRQ